MAFPLLMSQLESSIYSAWINVVSYKMWKHSLMTSWQNLPLPVSTHEQIVPNEGDHKHREIVLMNVPEHEM